MTADPKELLVYTCPECGRTTAWTDGRSTAAGDEIDEFWCQACGLESPLAILDGLKLGDALSSVAEEVRLAEVELDDIRSRRRALVWTALRQGMTTREVGALAGMTSSAVSQAMRPKDDGLGGTP